MFFSPLHTCVHCISRITDPSSCLHTCTLWRPRWNVHWYRQSFDWFVTLLHYLFSIKKNRVLVAKQELLISCQPNEHSTAKIQHLEKAWESPKWTDNLAGRVGERTVPSSTYLCTVATSRKQLGVKSTLCCSFISYSSTTVFKTFKWKLLYTIPMKSKCVWHTYMLLWFD